MWEFRDVIEQNFPQYSSKDFFARTKHFTTVELTSRDIRSTLVLDLN